MTELEEAELTDGQDRALSGHRSNGPMRANTSCGGVKALRLKQSTLDKASLAALHDVAATLADERDRLEQMELPTKALDDLLAKIEDEFRAEAAKYSAITVDQPVSNS